MLGRRAYTSLDHPDEPSGARMNIGKYSFEEFCELAAGFHGTAGPGLVIGGYMVEEAKSRLPQGTIFDAVSETQKCLPDSIQLLTPCSVGNGWLRIFKLGRFALSLYDKYTGEGVRVHLDVPKLEAWPEIKNWYLQLVPKREQNNELLYGQIRAAGAGICGVGPVRLKENFLAKERKTRKRPIALCSVCGEAYPILEGGVCHACRGEAPYAAETAD